LYSFSLRLSVQDVSPGYSFGPTELDASFKESVAVRAIISIVKGKGRKSSLDPGV
jgi:hypothetical protein